MWLSQTYNKRTAKKTKTDQPLYSSEISPFQSPDVHVRHYSKSKYHRATIYKNFSSQTSLRNIDLDKELTSDLYKVVSEFSLLEKGKVEFFENLEADKLLSFVFQV